MIKTLLSSNPNFSNKFTIKIYRNRIIEYNGVHNNRFLYDDFGEAKQHKINTAFELFTLDKFQKLEHETKAKYMLRYEQLEWILSSQRIYVNLSLFEYLRFKWYAKSFLIQSKEIKTDILKYIIGAILGIILSQTFESLKALKNNNQKAKEIKQRIEPNS